MAQIQCENLRSEREILKASESRLINDNSNLHADQCSQQLLLTNLQAIQVRNKSDILKKTTVDTNLQIFFTDRVGFI